LSFFACRRWGQDGKIYKPGRDHRRDDNKRGYHMINSWLAVLIVFVFSIIGAAIVTPFAILLIMFLISIRDHKSFKEVWHEAWVEDKEI
jgi:hypothetical protein